MFSFVITTINEPELLYDYHEYLKDRGIDHNFIVVPDNNTPQGVELLTKEIGGEYLQSNRLNIENDDARRQEGILRAIERQDDFIVLLDDDNFLNDDISLFNRVGKEKEMITLYSDTNWVNGCKYLAGDRVYPRGFPYTRKPDSYSIKVESQKVVVNAGLWSENPDVDALSCLIQDPRTGGTEKEFLLGGEQFCPINSQNTAYLGETLAGYYYPEKYDEDFKVGRFGDIFAGIFYEKIMHHMGGTVLFGHPVAKHKRNNHNYLSDLEWEVEGIFILEDIVDELENIELTEDTWGDCLYELVNKLKGTRKNTKKYLDFYRKGVDKWLKEL